MKLTLELGHELREELSGLRTTLAAVGTNATRELSRSTDSSNELALTVDRLRLPLLYVGAAVAILAVAIFVATRTGGAEE